MKKDLLKDAELLAHYLKATPENTKDGGMLRLKLPKPAGAEVIDLYLRLRAEGTKGGSGVFLSTKLPRSVVGEIADLYLTLRPEGTKGLALRSEAIQTRGPN